jgi:molybdopterin/thiamine biosynthesis adenylyltransferase
VNTELAYSRPTKTAEQLGNLAEDRHRFLHKRVLLTGEQSALTTANGRSCLLDSLRLLVRICPNVTVVLPSDQETLLEEAKGLAQKIQFGATVQFPAEAEFTAYDAILVIGSRANPGLPLTVVNSNGWLARVSSVDRDLPAECNIANPIGALGAACLGVGEVFKRLIRLKTERGELQNLLTFSFRTYTMGSEDPGPALPERIDSDFLIVGAGAIGNGLVHLAAHLPYAGQIDVVDRQKFGDENLGTCILIGPEELPKHKALVMEQYLNDHGKRSKGFSEEFGKFAEHLVEYPSVVLNGLDNIDVRHEVQRTLWPDVIIDGAIGDFMCQVSRHPWPDDVSCLICLFRKADEGKSAQQVQYEVTGLSSSVLAHPDAVLDEKHLIDVPPEKREFLKRHLGKPICSVVQEAMAQQISADKLEQGFQPSVPFVACFSACMVMSEAVAQMAGWGSKLEPRFQFDFLIGPAHGQELPQGRRPNCVCGRQKNINKLRSIRKWR